MKESAQSALRLLNSILDAGSRRMVSGPQMVVILDALAGAQDAALVARFPAVLAICARRGIELDSQALFARYWQTSPKRRNLEQLLVVSAELFRGEGLPAPGNLLAIADGLQRRHPHLPGGDTLVLAGGPSVPIAQMRTSLKQVAGGLIPSNEKEPSPAPLRCRWSPQLDRLLDLLFPEKQKELIQKRLENRRLTKTEREYYSRTVRKKLAAVADRELQAVAELLVTRSGRPGGEKLKRCAKCDRIQE
jgi:hypothetical protein